MGVFINEYGMRHKTSHTAPRSAHLHHVSKFQHCERDNHFVVIGKNTPQKHFNNTNQCLSFNAEMQSERPLFI